MTLSDTDKMRVLLDFIDEHGERDARARAAVRIADSCLFSCVNCGGMMPDDWKARLHPDEAIAEDPRS